MFFEALEGRALLAVDAINDAGTTNENTILTVVNPGSTTSLLANDTGTGTLSVTGFQSKSALGAMVNVNTNGTFTYNPTGAGPLQKLGAGQTALDTFTYTATDGKYAPDSRFSVQLLSSTGTVPGNDTANWLAVFNALDGGAGPTGTVAGFNIATNTSDTETVYNYAPGGSFGSDVALNTVNNDGPGNGPGPFGGVDNYALRGRSYLRFNSAGTYTIGLGSDDGRRISLTEASPGSAPGYSGFTAQGGQVNGTFAPGDTVIGFTGGTGHDWSVGTFTVAAGDILLLDAFYYQGNGGHTGEIAIASGAQGGFGGAFSLLTQGVLGIDLSSTLTSSDTATVSITVNGLNEAPVANPDFAATSEDTVLTVAAPPTLPGMNVAVYRGTNAGIGSLDTARAGAPSDTGTVLTADFPGDNSGINGGKGHFDNPNPVPGGAGENYGVLLTGFLRVTTAGTYVFGTYSDDASRIRIDLDKNGVVSTGGTEDIVTQPGCCNDKFSAGITLTAGDYAFEAMYTEGGGGDYGEFFYAPGTAATAFADLPFRILGDATHGIATFRSIDTGPLGNDTDEEITNGNATQSLSVTAVNGAPGLTGTSTMGAKVTMLANGGYTYDPNQPGSAVQALAAGQIANDTFTYTVSDNDPNGAKTSTATITIKVTGVNDLPTTTTDSYTTDENTTLVTTDVDLLIPRNNKGDATPLVTSDDGVLVNDTDVDHNDTLQVYSAQGKVLTGALGTLGDGSATVTTALGASLTISDKGTFSYNPTGATALQKLGAGQTAVDSFTYTATDGSFQQGFDVKVYQPTGANDLTQTDAFLAGARPNQKFSGLLPAVNFLGTGGAGQFNGVGTASSMDDEIPTPGLGAGDQNDFIVEAKGKIVIPAAGDYTFSVNSDDGFGLAFTNGPGTVNLVSVHGDNDGTSTTGTTNPRLRRSTGRGSTDTFGIFNFSAPGEYDLTLVNWEGGGGANVEFFGAPGAFTSFGATNTWRLVGDTDNGGLRVLSSTPNVFTATANITVTGINGAPVANADNYATNEDTALNVPAIMNVPGMNYAVYNQQAGDFGYGNAANADLTRAIVGRVPNHTGTISLADIFGNNNSQNYVVNNVVPGTVNNTDNYAVYLTGILRVTTAGQYTFGKASDDDGRFRIDLNQNGIIATDNSENVTPVTGCCGVALGAPVTLAVGDYAFEAMYTEGGGGDFGEFFYAPGNPAFSNTNYALIGDASMGIAAFSSIARPGLLGNDTDEEVDGGNPGQTLSVTQINGVTGVVGISALGAIITANADGSFSYNPNVPGSAVQALAHGQVAVDTFTYTVSDNAPAPLTAVATASITVTGRNDLPIAVNDNYTVNEDTVLNATDTDAAPRNQQGDTTPLTTNDDGVLVNDLEVDNLDVVEVMSTRTILGPGMNYAVYNQQAGDFGYGNAANADLTRAIVGRVPNQTGTIGLADIFGNNNSQNYAVNNVVPGTVNNTDNYAVYLTGILRVTTAGQYTFGKASDDDGRFRIDLNQNGIIATDNSENVTPVTGCCGVALGAPVTLAVGDYAFEAMYTEGGGGDFGEYFYAPGNPAFSTADYALIGDPSKGIASLRAAETTLSGTLGTLGNGSATFVTGQGATVVLDDDGTFTYDPTSSTTLQKLQTGQSVNDSFTYTATDNRFAPGMTIKVYQPTGAGDLAATDAFLAGARPNERFNGVRSTVNFFGTGSQGQFNGAGTGSPMDDEIPTPGLGGGDQNDFIVEATGKIVIPAAGSYTFSVNSDDGFGLTFSNGPGTVELISVHGDNDGTSTTGTVNPRLRRSTGRGSVDTFGVFNFSAPGEYDLNLVNWEGAGGANVEFFAAPGVFTTFGATNTWRLVGDTDNGGLQTFSLTRNTTTATVNITVNGVNDAPVAGDDGTFTTNENTSFVLTAGAIPGMNIAVYDGSNDTMPSADALRGSNTTGAPVNPPNATGTLLIADLGSNGDGSFPGQSGVPAPGGGDFYAVFLTGILRVNNASNPGSLWTFGTHADDSNRIRIDLDQDGILEGSLTTQGGESVVLRNGCCGSVLGVANVVIPDGDYLFEAMYTEGGGGDYGEFFYAPGNPAFNTTNYALIGDNSKGISVFRSIQGLLVNDSDIDNGDTIAVDTVPITSTKGATITPLADGSFTYDPSTSQAAQLLKDGETLTDTFDYILRDSKGGTDTGTVTVVVDGISDAVNDSYSVVEDMSLSVPAATGVLANDALPGNPAFTVVRAESSTVAGPTKITTKKGGEVVINPNGSFTYDQKGVFNSLPQGKNGADSFDYEISSTTGPSATGTVATDSGAAAYTVSSTDLLQGLTPTVTGNTLAGNEGTSNNPLVLTNGTYGPAGSSGNLATFASEAVAIQNGTVLTYALNLAGNPGGYDISQVVTYAGWQDAGRDNQDYTVEYSTVAAPGTWINFTTGAINFVPSNPPNGRVTISSPTGLLATGVGMIRFSFGTQENGYVGYRELDVIASPRSSATVNLTISGVNDVPTAEANGPYSIGLGQNLNVTGASSTDPDAGTVLQYGWDLDNNGTVDYTSAPPPANTAPAITIPWSALQALPTPLGAGTHTIRLIVSDGITTAFDTATLTISDTFTFAPAADGTPDGYLLIRNAAQTLIEVRDTATNTLNTSFPVAGTNSIVFTGNTDNETLTIDYTNTTPIPATSGVTFNAGDGTDGIVYRNGTVGTVAESYTTDNNGSTTIDSRVVTYTGLETLSDTLAAANRSFTFNGGVETVTLANLVAGTSLQIDSTLGVVTSFNKPTDSLAVNLATGSADTLNITSATLTGNFTVNGSDGNDNVNVNGAVVVTAGATLPGLVSVSGNNIAFATGSITTPNNVNLTAGGAITNTGAGVDVAAGGALSAAAVVNIDLDTSAATLSGTVSSAGGTLRFDEANAATLQNVTTNNGVIAITTAAVGDLTVEHLSSGTAAASITVNNGNLLSGPADPGTADIIAGTLTLSLSTGARNYGVSAANRLEIDAVQLRANTAGGMNNSAFIVDTAGGLQMNDSSLGATGVTVFDLVVQNGSLTSVVGGPGDIRAIQVIVAVTGATSTIGASAAAPLEINAATLDPAARFDATTAGAATSHVWVTDVADNFPIGTINAGLADVFLTSSFATGSIIDNAADSTNDIVAARLVLTATGGGIGNGANGNLETMLGGLEATAGTGGVNLANTGDLVIGGISGTVGVSATGGGVTISSVGSITANENVTATGAGSNVSLVTIDASTAGQDLNIGANATVGSATGSVTLNAGDNFSMGANSTINSPSSPLVINIDSGNADTTGGTLTIPNTATLNTPSATFNGANPGAATDIDTFTFPPLATVPIVVNGFNPTSGSGDVLNLDLAGATGTTLTIDGLNDGTYTFTNRASVEYNSIEVVNAIAGAYDLVLNMAGFGVPGDFTIRRNSPFVGANLEIVNNTSGTIPFAGGIAQIASLTVLGTTGNDRLVIDDVNGMVSFDPLLTPTAVFPDNPNGAGTPRLFFNADSGVDTLIFQLTEAGAQQTYHIGSGSGPGAGDGEVATTNTAGRNLVTYFTGLGTDGSSVVRSGSGAGAFTVAGDMNGNTINVQTSGTATRVDPVSYTPFDFAGNNFATLGVDGGLGADTLNLVSIGSGQTSPLATVLSGGADSDILRVQSTSGNTGTVTLNGNAGNDLFQLYSATNTVDGIAGQVIVDGTDGNVGGNTDTLVIVDTGDTSGDTVLLAAVNAASSVDYKLDGITGAGAGVDDVIIRNIDVLDYTGTSGDDIIDAQLVDTVPPHDLTSVTLNGWVGADQFLLFTSDQVGGSGPNNTPTGTPSGVATISLNGDAPGNPNGVDGNDVFGATPPGLTGTGSGNVGLTVPDTVRAIRPSLTTGIDINGGQPTGTVPPTSDTIGDTFNLDLSGLPANSFLILPTASGVVAASGLAPITYAQIEDINLILNHQLINVQMGDTLVRGSDNPDTILFSRNNILGPNGTRIRVNADFVDVVLSGKTLTFAGAGNDTVNQANVTRPAEIYGEAGNDYISGGTNNDFLVGGLDNDQINAGGGDNVVWGDDSPTTAVPNPQDLAVGGDDVLSGLGGNDVFYGGGGNDQVSAGGGNDYANGGQGNDILGGSDGDDRLYGGDGDDVLGGGAGHDLLSGGNSGNGSTSEFMDRLIGNSGNDILIGGFGVDDLSGGDGDDLLITGSVANETSSRTSVATTANYGAATYTDPADNDAALLNLLSLWSSVGDRTSLAAITHDGVDDDVFGFTGNDDFVWEAADLFDEGGKLVPPDYNANNMGADERFGPT